MASRDLIAYQGNVTSQCGEDGILAEICHRLDLQTGHFVEFGAWDGRRYSNTYSLLGRGWQGVYMEADESRYQELLRLRHEHPSQVVALCVRVGTDGESALDCILSKTSLPRDFDVLSIDIDSYDWQVWYSLQAYSPKVVIIEGNSQIAPGIWQIHKEGVCQGSSFTALVELGEHKGYKLVCHTGNLIFVRLDLVDRLDLDPVQLLFPASLFNWRVHALEVEYQRQNSPKSRSGLYGRLRRTVASLLRRA